MGMKHLRALSLFQPSNLNKAIRDTMDEEGNTVSHLYGSIMALPHTVVARTTSVLGFDFIMLDALHTAVDTESLIQLVQTINLSSEGDTVAVVRVPSEHSDLLTHALDAGAAGIVFPHIDTPEQAAEAARKSRYACSGGDRSLSPSALLQGVTDIAPPGMTHTQVADAHVAVICQIESQLGLDNVEAIAATPGVDALMLGPGDLRLSLGLPPRKFGEPDDPRFLAAVDRLIEVSKKYRKPLMTVSFKVNAAKDTWIRAFSMLLTSADIVSVQKGHQAELKAMQEALGTSVNGQANGHANGYTKKAVQT
ncbi:HpcH/HpaI aldolase/citrate lyase family protein [Aspergillus parasiticus]|uniref:HpcH/HpaI aldolase/citrate lyase family protein n=1 Tax=Aspergillus parasiticus TaxID=5067 RepID=A0A5N6E1Y8_ASPPA|nr:HpcH/HpaI aldolase/citrate lyase family protein [Aspergillus parasiticus]